MKTFILTCAVVTVTSAVACGGGHRPATVAIPPVLDLRQYGQVAGLVTFTVEKAKGSLHEVATRRFSEKVLGASRNVELLELGDANPLLKASGERVFGPASAKVAGATRNVPVVLVGHLKVSDVKPSGEPSFSAKDPNAAYGRLVNRLVTSVTRDLYPTYTRR